MNRLSLSAWLPASCSHSCVAVWCFHLEGHSSRKLLSGCSRSHWVEANARIVLLCYCCLAEMVAMHLSALSWCTNTQADLSLWHVDRSALIKAAENSLICRNTSILSMGPERLSNGGMALPWAQKSTTLQGDGMVLLGWIKVKYLKEIDPSQCAALCQAKYNKLSSSHWWYDAGICWWVMCPHCGWLQPLMLYVRHKVSKRWFIKTDRQTDSRITLSVIGKLLDIYENMWPVLADWPIFANFVFQKSSSQCW